MKNTVFYLMIISMTLLGMSCEEEDDRGQFATDGTSPGIVTDISVQNEKGRSILTYNNPLDEDLLYVEAKYTNSLGNEAVVRASAFTNTIELTGFLRSVKVPVEIIAVDKSFNQSEIVQVEVEPLDNPMFDVYESLAYNAIFGGVKLAWDNVAEQDVVVEFLALDSENGTYNTLQSLFSNAPNSELKIRGLEAVERDFGAVIRDEYGQRTDTLKFKATPLFEEQLTSEKFRELPNNPNFNTTSYNDGFGTLWNNAFGKDSYSTFGDGIGRVYVTMDLGEEVKLSRFKMWSRNDFIYAHSQPRHIVFLGTNDETLANDPFSDEASWDTIGEWIDEKPSGNSADIAPTEEDIAYFNSGMDFEVSVSAPSFRYLRFVSLESWGKVDRMWMAELKYWGNKI